MLKAKGEIVFTLEDKNYVADQLRPAFMFAEGLLFTGGIKSDNDMYYHGQKYNVDVEFYTVEKEAYSILKPLLGDFMDLPVCSGKRILGKATLRDFIYIDMPYTYTEDVLAVSETDAEYGSF